MKYTIDELTAAKRQIDSTLHKLRETVKTFESKDNSERYKSQITLAKRRIKAFEIANYFIILQRALLLFSRPLFHYVIMKLGRAVYR